MQKCFSVMRRLVLLPLLIMSPPSLAAQPPAVVATIAPVHSLVSAVMGQRGEPLLLLPGGVSPHRYALRPSDARALHSADLIVWVGAGLETFIRRTVDRTDGERLLSLAEAAGLIEWPYRSGGIWTDGHDHGTAEAHPVEENHDHDHEHRHDHESAPEVHDSTTIDPHYWLDPRNARVWVQAIAERLAAIDPPAASAYRQNAARYIQRIDELDARLARQLASVANRPYLVFHDAYQYFERRYSLQAVGSVAVASGRAPGVRRVLELRQRLLDSQARCLFSEPQFEPRLARRLVEDTGVRLGVLDPVGADTEPGPGHYLQLMDDLANALHDCLAR